MPYPSYGGGPGGAPPGSLAPAPSFGYAGAYGGIPWVPSPIGSQRTALGGNLGNIGSLYNLSRGVGRASAAGQATQYGANLPQYAGLTTQASRNIMSDLQGQVSPDVINLLAQTSAERGVGFGSDSPNTNSAFLRALGLTSMGLQAQGQQELTGAIGRTPVGPAFNPASFLVGPGDVQGAQMGANLYGSAPIPSQAAAAALGAANAGFRGGYGLRGGFAGGGGGTSDAGWNPSPQGPAPPFALHSLSPDLTYSGGASPAGYSNWADWARGIIGGGGGAPAGGGYMFTGPNTPNSPEDDAWAFSGGTMPGPAEVAPYDWSAGAGGATDYFSDGP